MRRFKTWGGLPRPSVCDDGLGRRPHGGKVFNPRPWLLLAFDDDIAQVERFVRLDLEFVAHAAGNPIAVVTDAAHARNIFFPLDGRGVTATLS